MRYSLGENKTRLLPSRYDSLGFILCLIWEGLPWGDETEHHYVTSVSSRITKLCICAVQTIQHSEHPEALIESKGGENRMD